MSYYENLHKAKMNGSRSENWQGGEPIDVRQLFFLLEHAAGANGAALRKVTTDLIEEMTKKKWEIIAGKLSPKHVRRNYITVGVNNIEYHLEIDERGYISEITKSVIEKTETLWNIPEQINIKDN